MEKLKLILILVLIGNVSFSQSKNYIDQPYIETTARVDTLVTPDRIFLSILISESDTKGKQTVEDLEFRMADKLKSIGISLEEQLTLTDLSSNFKKYFLRKQDILKAKAYELLVYDSKTAGQVIYEMENIGVSNVDLERTEYSEIEKLKLALKSRAIEKAKKQAEAMVKPIDQTIGKAIFISDINTQITNVLQGRVAGVQIRGYASLNKQYKSIPIEFEKIKVESEVNVKFIIN